MPRSVVYLIYNLLLPIVLLIGFPSFLVKGVRRGGLARNFRQRFGFFSPALRSRLSGERPIWIHAVSVGEVFLALKLIEAIRSRSPGQLIVLSTTTTTGYAVAEEKAGDRLIVIHNPVDLPWIASAVTRMIDPIALLLVEAEIWPNLVAAMKRRGIPVLLLNARLSPRSARRYRAFRAWVEPVFSRLDAVTIPFEADRARWSDIGIPEGRIHLLGSVKFDSTTAAGSLADRERELKSWLSGTGFPEGARILLGGSTHDGEEELLVETAREVRRAIPELAVVLVPRHAERGPALAAVLRAGGWDPVLREDKAANGATCDPAAPPGEQGSVSLDKRVWIANTTGELRAWFQLAEVVVIGKSFRGEGGQNPVEPILAGKPTVVGPNMQNFAEVVDDLIRADGLHRVESEDELPGVLTGFFSDPEAAREMAERGSAAMARHEGAADRNAELVMKLLQKNH